MTIEDRIEAAIDRMASRIVAVEARYLTAAGERIAELYSMTNEQLREWLATQRGYAVLTDDVRKFRRALNRAHSQNERDMYLVYQDVVNRTHKEGAALASANGQTLASRAFYGIATNHLLRDAMGRYKAMAASKVVDNTYRKTIINMVRLMTLDDSEARLDFPRAMRKAIRELTGKGITAINYASGNTMRMDSAVRRDLMGEFTGIVQDIQGQIGRDIGADGWEISAHEHPALDHEFVQGAVFENAEFEKLQNREPAVDIDGKTHHLEKRAIGQFNCRHIAFSFLIGISERSHSAEELEAIRKRNESGVTWKGKKKTLYQAEQEQRRLETAMRRQREELNALRPVRDTDPKMEADYRQASARLSGLRDEYNSLGDALEPHGLRKKWERSYVPRGSVGNAMREL